MRDPNIMKIIPVLLSSILLVACAEKAAETDTISSAAQPGKIEQEARQKPNAEFVELGEDEVDAPFTRERVIQLNAIVRRSLVLVEEFDDQVPAIRTSVADGTDAEAEAAMAKLQAMSERSKAVIADITAAEKDILSTGEKYNDAILAGMVGFIDDVDKELDEEIEQLSAKMAAR